MKKIPVFFLLLVVVALSSGCNDSATSSTIEPASTVEEAPVIYSIDELAEKTSSRLGELEKSYAIRPSGGVGFVSIEYIPVFDVGSTELKNVVAIEVNSEKNSLEDFASEYGTGELLDEYGTSFSDLSSGVYNDSANDKLYLLFYSESDISSYNYIVIGQFEKEKNDGKASLIFKIA